MLQHNQEYMREKLNEWKFVLSGIRPYNKGTAVKSIWYLYQNRQLFSETEQ